MSFFMIQKIMPTKTSKQPLENQWIKKGVTLCFGLLFTANAFSQQITGTVLNEQGQPIEGAVITLGDHLLTASSNEQGIFNFTEVKEGNYDLHASAKKYSHSHQLISVGADNIDAVNVVLANTVMEIIDVHATPLHSSTIESALPINVLSADELKMKQASTLGETLKNEVGVHSSYYGPVASTPIIRGLDGPRVLITQNGLDVGDASRVGPDHIVATETSTATQIEVLRGPATLFYGSGAIGGVVNVVDQRVPTSSEEQIDYLLQYNDVSNEKEASVNVQTGTETIAFHLDAFWRDSKDYKLAGPADIHDEEHDEEEHDDEHEEEHEDTESDGRLENSASNSNGGTIGSSYLFDQGFFGLSYGFMNREYGIPGHSHAHEEEEHEEEHDDDEHEEEHGVSAKMKQDRWQLLGEYNFDQDFLSKVNTKFSYSDYQHQEIEEDLVGTTFKNKSIEARADLFHQDYSGWQGAWTLHYKASDFDAQGEEAFSPPSKSDMIALAWLEEKHFGPVLLQLGARIEHVTIDADDTTIDFEAEHEEEHEEETAEEHEEHDHMTTFSFDKQSFTPISASAGILWDYQEGYNLGLSFAFSQRAPSSAELFSFGPHIGTSTFEVGAMFDLHEEGDEIHVEMAESSPEVETSMNLDFTLRKFNGDFGYVLSAFYNRIDDYYYQMDTGLHYEDEHDHDEELSELESEEEHTDEDGLPILAYQQNDVEMYGGEAEFLYQATDSIKLTAFADYIRARLVNDGGNLPRIPPLRLGGIFNYQASSFDGEVSVTHYFDQDDVAALETSTDGYTMLDAHLNFYIPGIGNDLVIFVKGQNLTDEHARVHSSFLKEVAPLPGRNLSLGIRGNF